MKPSQTEQGVCAVVVTYNIGKMLDRCINSVREQVGEIVVVDNGSGRETQDELDKQASLSRIGIIRNSKNEGIARAMNQGAKWAIARGFKYVLTLDHDSEATPGVVGKLVKAHAELSKKEAAKVGIVGANLFDRNEKIYLSHHRPDGKGGVAEIPHLYSSGSLIGVEVFSKVGFFEESLFVYYVDDDFCIRVLRAGLKLFVCPDAVLLHSEGIRTMRRFLHTRMPHTVYGKEAHYFLSRNVIYMLRKYPDEKWRTRAYLWRLRWDLLKIILYDRQKLAKLAYSLLGLWDGARGTFGPLPRRRIPFLRLDAQAGKR